MRQYSSLDELPRFVYIDVHFTCICMNIAMHIFDASFSFARILNFNYDTFVESLCSSLCTCMSLLPSFVLNT